MVSLDEVNKDPILAVKTNVQGTLNLLEITRRFDIDKFLYASSVAVYGEPIKLPIESDHPTQPANLYGLTKLMGEQLALQYSEEYGIKATSLRYFNAYGPRMHGGQYAGVIHKFITKMLRNENPPIFDDGSQTRDFVYVEDVAEANVKALFSKTTGVFNIGTGKPTTIKQLANIIMNIANTKAPLEYRPRPKGDPFGGYAETTLMKKLMEWEPKIQLKEGVKRYYNWTRLNKNIIPQWLQ